MITIERNQQHENNMTKVFETALANAQKAVNLFAELTGEPLKVSQWDKFTTDPGAVAKAVILEAVQVPDNMNRAKYLELIELPNFSELRSLCSAVDQMDYQFRTDYFTPLFLTYDGSEIKFTDMVANIIESKNVILSESEHEIYQLLDQFAALQNLIIQKSGVKLDLIKTNPAIIKPYGSTQYHINASAFKALINQRY